MRIAVVGTGYKVVVNKGTVPRNLLVPAQMKQNDFTCYSIGRR